MALYPGEASASAAQLAEQEGRLTPMPDKRPTGRGLELSRLPPQTRTDGSRRIGSEISPRTMGG